MSTHLVVIGDMHFSRNARQAQRLKALDTIIEEGLRLPSLGAWLLAGDLFHAKSTVDDRNELAERLVLMASRAPVSIARGNHDVEGDLIIFARLGTVWPITVDERPNVRSLVLATGQLATIFVLPWPSEAGLVSAGVAPADIPAAARAQLESIFIGAGGQLAAARDAGHLTAFLGHVTVSGAIASNGQPQMGLGIEIDGALLARLGHCPKFVGHIHKGQEIAGAVYPGSICRLDFGEIEDKRYLVASFDGPHRFTVDEHRIDVPGMWHVAGRLTRGGFTFRVTKGPAGEDLAPPATWRGQEVRARIAFDAQEKPLLEMAKAHVLAEFAEAAHVLYEYVPEHDQAVRSPAVAAAVTLADKVTAWAETTSTELPSGLLPRLADLEQADQDRIVADVRARMVDLVSPPVAREEAVA